MGLFRAIRSLSRTTMLLSALLLILQSPGTSTGAPPTGQAATDAATTSTIDWATNFRSIYVERTPDPIGAELLVLYPADRTGLKLDWNREMCDTLNVAVANWMAAAGRPVTTADPRNTAQMMTRRKTVNVRLENFPTTAAAEVGRHVGAGHVVQWMLDRTQTTETRLQARVVDVAGASAIAELSLTTPEPKATHDTVLDMQIMIAPAVAAHLLGHADADELLAALRARKPSVDESGPVRAALDEARELLLIPSQARVHRALRLATGVAFEHPGATEAWALAALAHAALASQFEKTKSYAWQDARIRAQVAASTAMALAPEDPSARIANVMALLANGRQARALVLARHYAAASPDDVLVRALAAAVSNHASAFPALPEDAAASVRHYHTMLRAWLDNLQRDDMSKALAEEVLKREAFAPGHLLVLADAAATEGDLGLDRIATAEACIQGAMMALVEAVRVYEIAGDTVRADELLAELKSRGFPDVQATTATARAPAPRSDALVSHIRRLRGSQFKALAREFINADPEADGGRLLSVAVAETHEAREVLAARPGVRPARSPIVLEGDPALDAAIRTAADGAAGTVVNIGLAWNVPEVAEPAIEFFEGLFPRDPALLYSVHRYLWSHGTFARRSEYWGKVLAENPDYLPLRQDNVFSWHDTIEKQRTTINNMRALGPFDHETQRGGCQRLYEVGDHVAAASCYAGLAERYPLDFDSTAMALFCRAISENRRVTRDEAGALLATLPDDTKLRARVGRKVFADAACIPEAIEHTENWIALSESKDVDDYEDLARLYLLAGDRPKAEEALLRFTKKIPDSLATCMALITLSQVRGRHGDREGAWEALRGAGRVDSAHGGVMMRHAQLLYNEGSYADAAKAYLGLHERYGIGGLGMAARALVLVGREDTVMPLFDEVLSATVVYHDDFGGKAAIFRKRGDLRAALQVCEAYNESKPRHSEPALLLRHHFDLLGDAATASRWAEEALSRLANYSDSKLREPRLAAGLQAARSGNADRARELAHVLEVRKPVEMNHGIILAEIALQAGDPDAALRELDGSLRLGLPLALSAAARAHMAKGDTEKAYEHAKRAFHERHFDDWRTALVMAQAAAATGRTDEARMAAHVCACFGPDTEPARRAAELQL